MDFSKIAKDNGVRNAVKFLLLLFLLLASFYFLSSSSKRQVTVDVGGKQALLVASMGGKVILVKQVNGREEIALPSGNVVLAVSSQGYLPAEETVNSNSQQEVHFNLKKITESIGFLVLTSGSRLEGKYGKEEGARIFSSMQSLASQVEKNDGLASLAAYVDEDNGNFKEFDDTGMEKAAQDAIAKYSPKYVLIVGGDSIIPIGKESNPLKLRGDEFSSIAQADSTVLTDNVYSSQGSIYAPNVFVGRLPDYEGSSSEELVSMLDNAALFHSQKNNLPTSTFVFYSQDTLNQYPAIPSNSKIISPTFSILDSKQEVSQDSLSEVRKGFDEVNLETLHGNSPGEEQMLVGKNAQDGSLSVAYTPAVVGAEVKGKLFILDSCYGASPERNAEGSVSYQLLKKGALAFIGSTMTSLTALPFGGSFSEESLKSSGGANDLTYTVRKKILQGERVGQALTEAKRELDYSRPVDALTSLEFIAYGDPTVCLNCH